MLHVDWIAITTNRARLLSLSPDVKRKVRWRKHFFHHTVEVDHLSSRAAIMILKILISYAKTKQQGRSSSPVGCGIGIAEAVGSNPTRSTQDIHFFNKKVSSISAKVLLLHSISYFRNTDDAVLSYPIFLILL
jgi:hypothetical protein